MKITELNYLILFTNTVSCINEKETDIETVLKIPFPTDIHRGHKTDVGCKKYVVPV